AVTMPPPFSFYILTTACIFCIWRPPSSTLFPYTTLFRSERFLRIARRVSERGQGLEGVFVRTRRRRRHRAAGQVHLVRRRSQFPQHPSRSLISHSRTEC